MGLAHGPERLEEAGQAGPQAPTWSCFLLQAHPHLGFYLA